MADKRHILLGSSLMEHPTVSRLYKIYLLVVTQGSHPGGNGILLSSSLMEHPTLSRLSRSSLQRLNRALK